VDVGAEVGRAATMDEKGNVQDVVIQEECAAGAGTFIETMARALEVSLEEMGTMALQSSKAIPMNAQCVVFAESEVIGLIHGGADKRDISKSVHDAVAGRIVSMVQRMGVKGGVILMGGMARNPGFVTAVKQGLKLENVYVPKEPEYGAAIGASIAASEYP
jgi:benzoyl-CoA reductase subunit D